jgi:hypothetical protein
MATLAGAFIACGGSGTAGSGPDASALDTSGDDGAAVDTATHGDSGCPPPSSCGDSGGNDAPAADTAIDAGADRSTTAGDSGGDSSASCLGSVTFHVVPGTHASYCGPQPCSTLDLVSVLGAQGQTLKIAELASKPCPVTDCSSCLPAGLGANAGCTCDGGTVPMPRGGIDLTWSGTIWAPAGTCSQPWANSIACDLQGCARAGQYTAHVCALPGPVDASTCNLQASPVCVDVPFTYPPHATVVATMP